MATRLGLWQCEMQIGKQKFLKLGLGGVLALVGGYILLSEGIAVVSADAVVNARVALVRAPIDGVLSLQPRQIGEAVRQGEPLGSLNDVRADTARLLDLQQMESELAADVQRAGSQLESVQGSLGQLQGRSDAYRTGRIAQLEAEIDVARALRSAALARLEESGASLKRAQELRDKGSQSIASLDKARTARDVDMKDAEAAEARLRSLEIQLAAAREGTFLGDSFNDTPFSSQRAFDLELREAELRSMLADYQQRLVAVRGQIEAERARVAQLRDAFLTSPVDGLVWEAPLGNAEYARKGQDLLRLLDCSTVIVTASVGESDYNRLKVGDAARFRLSGTSKVFDGVILRLAGSGAATVYNNLAIAPGEKHLERFDVALRFPDLLSDPEAGCAVGRTGRVVFTGAPRDIFRSIGRWLGFA